MSESKREFTPEASAQVRSELERLLNNASSDRYRQAMIALGRSLGHVVQQRMKSNAPFALVSTPEDADFLVSGMLESLPKSKIRLVCYWTSRKKVDDGDVATVIQQYVDPRLAARVETVIIAKAIVSSGCIVRANLETFLNATQPSQIIIAAPVMVKTAPAALKSAFSSEIAQKLEFVTFARDPIADAGGIVKPGIGGIVEEQLGLSQKPTRFFPDLIANWRDEYAPAG